LNNRLYYLHGRDHRTVFIYSAYLPKLENMKNKMPVKHAVDNEIELSRILKRFWAARLREALKGMHIIYYIIYDI